MSRITFSTRSGHEAEVSGRERHHMGWLLNQLFWGLVPKHDMEDVKPWLIDFQNEIQHYKILLTSEQYREAGEYWRWLVSTIGTAVNVGWQYRMKLNNGETELAGTLASNTALAIGNEPLKLFSRLHNQCEIHAWVAGKHRAWLADTIEEGLEIGMYRQGMGWQGVIDLLRSSKRGAVVSEYSVTDSFHWGRDKLQEDTEISPERNVHFGEGYTVFDLARN